MSMYFTEIIIFLKNTRFHSFKFIDEIFKSINLKLCYATFTSIGQTPILCELQKFEYLVYKKNIMLQNNIQKQHVFCKINIEKFLRGKNNSRIFKIISVNILRKSFLKFYWAKWEIYTKYLCLRKKAKNGR